MKQRKLMCAVIASACAVGLGAGSAWAQQGKLTKDTLKIGVLSDMSGVYAEAGGPGATLAAKMAVEDFGGRMFGKPIEVVSADHQNKPDIAKNVTLQWFDRDGVMATFENLNSGVALAVTALGKEKNRLTVFNGAATSRLTNDACQPTAIQYLFDTIALGTVVGKAIVKAGGDSWFFLTADYTFGHTLEKDTGEVVKAAGGKVLGAVRHPLNAGDFSSFLLQAQASKAKIIGLANAGGDTINSIKSAAEFGLTKHHTLAALLLSFTEVHAVGLNAAQGLYLTEAWYWDTNAETRAWTKKYEARMKKKPNAVHASVYSSVLHYLKAVQAAGTDDTTTVIRKMKDTPINDMFAANGRIRADGLHVHDMYLFQVKKPSESKASGDYYHLRATVKGEDAFQSLEKSRCPAFMKKS